MTMHTEGEAKKLWCPMVRLTPESEGHHCLNNREEPLLRDTVPGSLSRCLASGCAMWRREMKPVPSEHQPPHEWVEEPTGRGWCGLAGRPE